MLPVAGVVGGAVQVGRGIANQSEAIREKKAGKVWNKVHPRLDGPSFVSLLQLSNMHL